MTTLIGDKPVDYDASKTAEAASSSLVIEPCESLEPLADIRGGRRRVLAENVQFRALLHLVL